MKILETEGLHRPRRGPNAHGVHSHASYFIAIVEASEPSSLSIRLCQSRLSSQACEAGRTFGDAFLNVEGCV
jgi:hypothetical protein